MEMLKIYIFLLLVLSQMYSFCIFLEAYFELKHKRKENKR